MAVVLAAIGVLCLAVFAWLIYAPSALLVLGIALLTAGLLVDWEKLRGKPDSPPPRR